MAEPVTGDAQVSADLHRLRERTSAKWRAFPADVIPAWIAEMDMPLAEPIAEALHAAVNRSDTGYRWVGELPAALAEFAGARWAWDIDPDRVIVLPDVLTAICQTIQAFTEPGAGVVINPPVYPPFFSSIEQITGRSVVSVPMIEDGTGRVALDLDGLERAFARPDVSAYLLCSPHNPTGSVPTRSELEQVAQSAARHQVAVIADEIHAPLTHLGTTHVPFLSIAPADLGAVSLVSASKGWNLAGLKCAQVVAGSAEALGTLVGSIPIEVTYGTGHFGVLASIAAYRDSVDWLDQTVQALAANGQALTRLLPAYLPGIGYQPPNASYLAWLDCRSLGLGDDPAAAFLERSQVALNAGLAFGPQGAGFVRLNFGTTPAILEAIVQRLGTAISGT